MDDGGTANGGADTSPTQTFLVQVTPVNDAPSFALPGSPDQTVLQDAGAQTVSSFATLISAGPVDEAGQALTFHVSNNYNALFTVQPSINEVSGNLTYLSAPGVSGAATVSVYLMDNGGTANGGVDTSATQSFLINVVPPNASPTAQGQTVSTDEDTLLPLTLTGIDSDSPSLTFAIVAGPAHGLLGSLGAPNCVAGTCSAAVDYTPAADYNGPDSFTFKVNDGLVDSNTATVAITVDAVNDPPSFTKGIDQTVLEDAGAQTAAGWATAISPGPADESGQSVAFSVTGNTNLGLFAAAPAVAANGDLTYTPAPNAFGSATITLVAQDSGGTANGGNDTSASQTFDITVTPVNDAPAFTKGVNQTVDEDAGAQSVAGWATGISAGPSEAGQGVTFVIDSNDNSTLFSAGPTVASDGTLTFTPAANKNGVANITLYVQDDGGTANGGDDTSDPQTFVITVNAINDAPLAIAQSYAAQANMQIVGLTGLLTGATDPDASDSGFTSQLQVGSVSGTTPSGGTVTLTNAGTGTFSFDPPPGRIRECHVHLHGLRQRQPHAERVQRARHSDGQRRGAGDLVRECGRGWPRDRHAGRSVQDRRRGGCRGCCEPAHLPLQWKLRQRHHAQYRRMADRPGSDRRELRRHLRHHTCRRHDRPPEHRRDTADRYRARSRWRRAPRCAASTSSRAPARKA